MNTIRQVPIPFDFDKFGRESRPRHRALLLDYDGTLTEFRAERMKAVPSGPILCLLKKLAALKGARVALISGRSVQELHELLGDDLAIEMWGAHGWERWKPGGAVTIWNTPRQESGVFLAAASLVEPLVEQRHLDIKSGSIAVHTRALSETERREVAGQVPELWSPLADEYGLQILYFDGGIELRDALRTKATAVLELREELPQDALLCYLGDDVTDEDAFAVLREDDWGILVSESPRPSHGRFWLRPGEEVARFLEHWIDWGGGRLATD